MSDELVTIATYDDPAYAHIVQAELESEGIDSYLLDENVANMFWHLSAATRGVKLQVRQSDASQAQQIISEKVREPTPVEISPRRPRCPRCDSSDISHGRPRRWLLILLAIAIPLIPIGNALGSSSPGIQYMLHTLAIAVFAFLIVQTCRARKWICADCRHQWKQK